MHERAVTALGQHFQWLTGVVRNVRRGFHRPPVDAPDTLARYIAHLPSFRQAMAHPDTRPRIRHWLVAPTDMGRMRWPVPALPTTGELAAWLGLSDEDLDWLADRKGYSHSARDTRLLHYQWRWVPKRTGGVRLLESPKARLKALQRQVLHAILDAIPPHESAHAFQQGRSVLTFAAPHVGQHVLLRMDLEDFFTSISAGRVFGVFRTAGYPEAVSSTLASLCTHALPLLVLRDMPRPASVEDIDAHWRARARLSSPHLPQGAPTSPALANLCAWGLDVRLSTLAASMGVRYSRYADDLVFSGGEDLSHALERFRHLVETVIRDEGFVPNVRKTRVLRQSVRQQVAGVVVNARPNVPRADFDTLKATLTNCIRQGPSTQNHTGHPDFRAHLVGRVAWVASVHPQRGARLHALLDAIDWSR
ncbi:reverse transcriptase family protein [Pyxidicoccus caerfyrddinensis]|uniref:reverse transcriptase family protein n=1 Tax=Pyxidicoccus caerfyrddinensis TaxID=2709663 RepID=UPI001F071268|nr:reverse transcriptase family protein [Pyxidicoccus caerfyrddinensis]